jgi:site-specific recombinase XerD
MAKAPRQPKPRKERRDKIDYTVWPPFAFEESSDWGKCYSSFLRSAYERGGSTSTLSRYRQALMRFFSDPAKQPQNYTRADVDAFLHQAGRAKGRMGQPNSTGTRNGYLSILNSFYAYSAAYSVVNTETGELESLMSRMSPTSGLKSQKREQPPYKSLNSSELSRFFDQIPLDTLRGIRDRAIFKTLFFTARRVSEIASLKFGDLQETIVFDANGTRRVSTIYHFRGKGRKMIDDTAELAKPAKEAIDWYLLASGRIDDIKASDPLFVGDEAHGGGGKTMRVASIWYNCKKYAKLAGLDHTKISPHSFRHTSARLRMENGAELRDVQKLLRHASIATTDVYVRQLLTESDPNVEVLSARFGNL